MAEFGDDETFFAMVSAVGAAVTGWMYYSPVLRMVSLGKSKGRRLWMVLLPLVFSALVVYMTNKNLI